MERAQEPAHATDRIDGEERERDAARHREDELEEVRDDHAPQARQRGVKARDEEQQDDRFGLAEGDPQYAEIQRRLALPVITVPSITLDGADDGVAPATDGAASAPKFTARRMHRVVPGAGHNLPQEAPEAFAAAVMELLRE